MKNFFQSCWNTTVDYFKFIGNSFKATWKENSLLVTGLVALDVLSIGLNFYLYGFAWGMMSIGVGLAVFFGVMGYFYHEHKEAQAISRTISLALSLPSVPKITVVNYSSDYSDLN